MTSINFSHQASNVSQEPDVGAKIIRHLLAGETETHHASELYKKKSSKLTHLSKREISWWVHQRIDEELVLYLFPDLPLPISPSGLEATKAFQGMLEEKDIWMHVILPFVRPGNYIYVASVCKRFKELYLAYLSTFKKPEKVTVWRKVGEGTRHTSMTMDVIPKETFYSAAFSSVSCAEYWYKIAKDTPRRLRCSWTCQTVAKYGNLQVLKWAHQKKFPWDEATCSDAAEGGHLEVLKYAHENGCPWNSWTCASAAYSGNLEVMKYVHENGCPWDRNTCAYATKNGHLDILKYAHEHGCPWDPITCSWAAECGHLEVLKYAHENGCEWDEYTCINAAENGDMEVLKYAHEKECPWNEETCTSAAKNGHLEVLKYAHQENCPWDKRTYTRAVENGHNEIARWAREHGCPWE